MTHQKENAVFEAVTAILIEHGPAAMASAFGIIMNVAMEIEREQTLKAESHQRTAARQGYANGFKPKTINTRVGEVSLRIPQARDYHDEQGRTFYPKSLERGVRSERAMTHAVAEMDVQGGSSRAGPWLRAPAIHGNNGARAPSPKPRRDHSAGSRAGGAPGLNGVPRNRTMKPWFVPPTASLLESSPGKPTT